MANEQNSRDVYSRVTDSIIAAIEKGASAKDWRMPWQSGGLLARTGEHARGRRGGSVITVLRWLHALLIGAVLWSLWSMAVFATN